MTKRKRERRSQPAKPQQRDQRLWIPIVVLTMAGAWWFFSRGGEPSPLPHAQAPAARFEPTRQNTAAASVPAPEGMVWIPGGEFSMGAADPTGCGRHAVGMQATTDARPIHRVYVDGFWMDETEVTNAQFAGFVAARPAT